MMRHTDRLTELSTQKRLARKYKVLGYEVQENPSPDRLPDFMRGVAPDIVARSSSDNVVIEIKTHAALKGSNDIVGIAERVSGHPDWRFELVVLEDTDDQMGSSELAYQSLIKNVSVATTNRLFDIAFVYLVNILVETARDLATRSGMSSSDRGDRTMFLNMGFRGILPSDLVEQCLSALSMRNRLAHADTGTMISSELHVQDLLKVCEELRAFL